MIIILCCFLSKIAIAQPGPEAINNWERLQARYRSGAINDSVYFKITDSLITGIYGDTLFKDKLSTFRKAAFSKEKYHYPRMNYYVYLANNASYTYNSGASIYYAEKIEEERKKMKPYMNTLIVPQLKVVIYNGSLDKCLATFKEVLPFIKRLPTLVLTDTVPEVTYMNAMALLETGTQLYTLKHDTTNAHIIRNISEQLWNSLQQKHKYTPGDEHMVRTLNALYLTRFFDDKETGNLLLAKQSLSSARTLLSTSPSTFNPTWKAMSLSAIYLHYINLFIALGEKDSTACYFHLLKDNEAQNRLEFGNGSEYLYNLAKVKASEQDYKTAYTQLLRAYEINDSVIAMKTADISNNLYAQAEAEFNRDLLKEAEAQKTQRSRVIGIISAIFLCIIILLYKRMQKRDRVAKEKIDRLNYASQLQIMELEEKSLYIKKEQQKMLGMDLHDTLAGSLATIKTRIETEICDNENQQQADRLKNISKMVSAVYEETRHKSHKLYYGKDVEEDVSFSKRINLIAENALVAHGFDVAIETDDELLQDIPITVKIALLYIIQEAVVNIIRHSRANRVSIFIYEDIHGLVMQIRDNGRGFEKKRHAQGIGLRSINERVKMLHGTVEIISGDTGTEIIVTTPVTRPAHTH